LTLAMISIPSYGFDLEDYATTYRATTDAYLKAKRDAYLSQIKLGTIVKQFKVIQPVETDFAYSLSQVHSCSGIMESKIARSNSSKVISELEAMLTDPMVINAQNNARTSFDSGFTQVELKNRLARVKNYYQRLDPSLDQVTDLLREPTSYADEGTSLFDAQFDREDFATSFRATRDEYLKALNELRLATFPYLAAKNALMTATQSYLNHADCAGNLGLAPTVEEMYLRHMHY